MSVNYEINTDRAPQTQKRQPNTHNYNKENLRRGFSFIVEALSKSQEKTTTEIDQEKLLETVEQEFLDYDHAVSTYFSVASIPTQEYGLYRPGQIPQDEIDNQAVEAYFEKQNLAVLKRDSEMTKYCQELEIDKDRLCRALDNTSRELLEEYVIGEQRYQ